MTWLHCFSSISLFFSSSFTVFLSCFEILCLCPGSYCPLVSSSLHCIALNLKVHQKSLIKSAISPIDNRPSVHQYNLSSTRAGLIYRFHSGLRSSHAKLQNLNFPVVFTIPQWIWGNWLGKEGANRRRVTVTPFLPLPHLPPLLTWEQWGTVFLSSGSPTLPHPPTDALPNPIMLLLLLILLLLPSTHTWYGLGPQE